MFYFSSILMMRYCQKMLSNVGGSAKKKDRKEKKRHKCNRKQRFIDFKDNLPDQNVINLSKMTLKAAQKSLLKKVKSFVPTLSDVNWLTL